MTDPGDSPGAGRFGCERGGLPARAECTHGFRRRRLMRFFVHRLSKTQVSMVHMRQLFVSCGARTSVEPDLVVHTNHATADDAAVQSTAIDHEVHKVEAQQIGQRLARLA